MIVCRVEAQSAHWKIRTNLSIYSLFLQCFAIYIEYDHTAIFTTCHHIPFFAIHTISVRCTSELTPSSQQVNLEDGSFSGVHHVLQLYIILIAHFQFLFWARSIISTITNSAGGERRRTNRYYYLSSASYLSLFLVSKLIVYGQDYCWTYITNRMAKTYSVVLAVKNFWFHSSLFVGRIIRWYPTKMVIKQSASALARQKSPIQDWLSV